MFRSLILFTILMICLSCKRKEDSTEIKKDYQCTVIPLQNSLTRIQLLQSFDQSNLQGIATADAPNSDGAMGRNKSGYFHVRFQMGISTNADYAVASQNVQALEYSIKAIEYSFAHQLPAGDFRLVIPAYLAGQTPTQADLASGVAFFLSSVGVALNNFAQSSWYNSAALVTYKNRVEALRPKIALAASWLLAQKSILEVSDATAPNRLFFDALAYYSLGSWLNDDNLKHAGLAFAARAVLKKHEKGYFLEGDGWDSSYQGVALNVGFNLFSILDPSPFKMNLWDCLSCAADWQKSRILSTGEITTAGNTRVYPGGEQFLGKEKKIDWIKSMVAMFMMGYYSQQASFLEKATKIKAFYY